jgi:hypothetical protein
VADDIVSLGGPERRFGAQRIKAWVGRVAGGRGRLVAMAVAAALVIGVPVTAAVLRAGPAAGEGGGPGGAGGPHGSGPGRGVAGGPGFPAATVARVPVSGVVDLAGEAGQPWAVRFLGPRSGGYQLVKIDVRTDKVMLRVTLGQVNQAVAAGAGTVWLTTSFGRERGQLERIDPATGHVVKIVRLPGVWCGWLTFTASGLLAECRTRPPGAKFVLLNPVTGATEWESAPMSNALALAAAAPDGVWYTTSVGLSGLARTGSRARSLTARAPVYSVSLAMTQSLVYGAGFVWAMTGDESVAKIDPLTGRLVRLYTYRTYDPSHVDGLTFLALGQGSLWFLSGGQRRGVLRVSMATGRPIGWVPPHGIGSCGQPCGSIYDTQGAVWVPTTKWLIKIYPSVPTTFNSEFGRLANL